VRHTEYQWVRKVTREIERELEGVRERLSECALGSPDDTE
jgi:hypothetical protein